MQETMDDEDHPATEENEPTKGQQVAPDGGWGWMVVVGAFITYFIADGCSFSFGVLYEELLDHFQQSRGKTAVIVALLYGFPLLISPVVCALVTVLGSRTVGMCGGTITSVAFIISIFAGSVEYLCISIGLLGSIGLAMSYISAMLIVANYFEKRRGLATGLSVCGSGIGTLVFAPLLEYLLTAYAWKGTMLLLAGLCLHITIAASLYRPLKPLKKLEAEETLLVNVKNDLEELDAMKKPSGNILVPRVHDSKEIKHHGSHALLASQQTNGISDETKFEIKKLSSSSPDVFTFKNGDIENSHPNPESSFLRRFQKEMRDTFIMMKDTSIIKNIPFLMFCLSNFLLCMWYGAPYVYVIDWAMNRNIEQMKATFLVSIIGICSTFGQVILGHIADVLKKPLVVYSVSMVICGFAMGLMPAAIVAYPGIATTCGFYGFFIGANYSLSTAILIKVVGLEKLNTAFGWLQLGQGIATLVGTPVAGMVYDATGEYSTPFIVAGVWIMICGIVLIPVFLPIRCMRQHLSRVS